MASVRKRTWTHNGQTKEAWVVEYTDKGGKRRRKTFPLGQKGEANRYRSKVEIEVDKRLHVATSRSVTVTKAFDEYTLHMQQRHREGRGVGEAYLASIRTGIGNHFIPHIGAIKVSELTFHDVEDCLAKMRAKEFAPYTIRNWLTLFCAMIDFCIRHGYIAINPVKQVLEDLGSTPRTIIRTPDKTEFAEIIRSMEDRPRFKSTRAVAMARLAVHIAGFCALRVGEFGALRLQDVDLEGRIIRVRKSVTIRGLVKAPKSRAGVRDVPMPEHIAVMLEDWIAKFYIANDGARLFMGEHRGDQKGMPAAFPRANLSYHWHDIQERAGIGLDAEGNRMHFHALRHFAVSMWLNAGIPVPDVAKLAGHSHFDMTLQVYSHALMEKARQSEAVTEAAQRLVNFPLLPVMPLPATRQERDIRRQGSVYTRT